MKKLAVMLLLFAAGTTAFGQVTRQESTKALKKVVYSGDPALFPQVVVRSSNWGNGMGSESHYAVISLPELVFNNLPVFQVYYLSTSGWRMDCSLYRGTDLQVTDGQLRVQWKNVDEYGYEDIFFRQFKTVVTYESGVTLDVENPGTGKSLDLKWSADATVTNKIQGYEVHRRPKQ